MIQQAWFLRFFQDWNSDEESRATPLQPPSPGVWPGLHQTVSLAEKEAQRLTDPVPGATLEAAPSKRLSAQLTLMLRDPREDMDKQHPRQDLEKPPRWCESIGRQPGMGVGEVGVGRSPEGKGKTGVTVLATWTQSKLTSSKNSSSKFHFLGRVGIHKVF